MPDTQRPDIDVVVANLIRALTGSPVRRRDLPRRHAGRHLRYWLRHLGHAGVDGDSRDARVATENFTAPALYAVVAARSRGGRRLPAPREREVTFLPGTLFRAVTQVRFQDLPVVVVEELDLDRAPDARRATSMSSSRGSPRCSGVTSSAPGRRHLACEVRGRHRVNDALLAAVADLPARSALCFVGVEDVRLEAGPTSSSPDRAASTDSAWPRASRLPVLPCRPARRVVTTAGARREVVLMPAPAGDTWGAPARATSSSTCRRGADGRPRAPGARPTSDADAQALAGDRAHERPRGLRRGGSSEARPVPAARGSRPARAAERDAVMTERGEAWFASRRPAGVERS